MKTGHVAVGVILAVLPLGVDSFGGQAPREYDLNFELKNLTLGDTAFGKEWTVEQLANHVVLIEMWGINCGPCLASIPTMSRLHDQYESQGLVVIGIHRDHASNQALKALAKEKHVTYTIVATGDIKGYEGGGIPHIFLFDSTGKCIFRGLPSGTEGAELQEKLKEAVASAPFAALGGRDLVKLGWMSESLKRGAPPATVLLKARNLLASGDEQTADEAKFIVESLMKWGESLTEDAVKKKSSNPLKCLAELQRIAVKFGGTDIAQKAIHTLSELKNDNEFQTELKAHQVLDKIRSLEDQIQPLRDKDGEDTTSRKFVQKNYGLIKNIITGARVMEKRFPNASATAQAREIAGKYEELVRP